MSTFTTRKIGITYSQNPYVKQVYIRITYEQKSVYKTVVGKRYIRIPESVCNAKKKIFIIIIFFNYYY